MKKIILMIILSVPTYMFSQKLEENKTDEFTKSFIKRTSWETLNSFSKSFSANYRISKIDSVMVFDLKMMAGSSSRPEVFSIQKGAEIMFKLDNGEIVSLYNIKFAVTCTGCGATGFVGSAAQGIQTQYLIDKSSFEKLLKNKVVKIRIYTTDGYYENDIKEKRALEFIKSLNLIL